jgi:hypothetical protein
VAEVLPLLTPGQCRALLGANEELWGNLRKAPGFPAPINLAESWGGKVPRYRTDEVRQFVDSLPRLPVATGQATAVPPSPPPANTVPATGPAPVVQSRGPRPASRSQRPERRLMGRF